MCNHGTGGTRPHAPLPTRLCPIAAGVFSTSLFFGRWLGACGARNVKWKHARLSRSDAELPALALVASKRIAAGAEIICAYNNEEMRAYKRAVPRSSVVTSP